MSADDWATCPRCFSEAQQAAVSAAEQVASAYGKVPVEEFDAARAALRQADVRDFQTFREDYEFYGADEGEIRVSYQGGCSKCGLGVELVAAKRFWPESS